MPEQDPLADMISLVAAPIAGAVRSVEQFRMGVDEFLRGIENFNRTMETLNETAERMNVLLQEVEEPIKAAVPQVTRAINNADEMIQVVSGPAMAAAPGFARLVDTMNSPAFRQLPDQLATFSEAMVDMSSRMAPLTQFAETAGGLFGMRKPAGSRASGAATTPSGSAASRERDAGTERTEDDDVDEVLTARSAARTASGSRKITAKKVETRRSTGTKSTARKAPKTTPAERKTRKKSEESTAEDTAAEDTAVEQGPIDKAPKKSTVKKKSTAKKSTAKTSPKTSRKTKTSAKKTGPDKSSPEKASTGESPGTSTGKKAKRAVEREPAERDDSTNGSSDGEGGDPAD